MIMGLSSDYGALSATETNQATLDGAVVAAQVAAAANAATVTTESQAVVADLSAVATYPSGQALLPDPSPLPGGSFILIALDPGSTLGFTTQQVPVAQ
jgi:hypothetical protein